MERGFKGVFLTAMLIMALALSAFGYGTEGAIVNNDGITRTGTPPQITGNDKIVLTVDQHGNLSSTNAIATATDLAAVAASNQLAIAVQEANEDGYRTSTNLLDKVAASVASSPIVFCSPEITSFIAATVFDEATSNLRIFNWEVRQNETATKTINGTPILCVKCVCGYMFTSPIDTAVPLVRYSETVDGMGPEAAITNYLADVLVEAPTPVQHEPYTDSAGWVFTDFYTMNIWIPQDRSTGFFRIVVEGSAPTADGNTIDTVGVKGGYTGVITNGASVINVRGGYIMESGTGLLLL